ncbi:hypothetical protein BDV96DRAFT_667972 [Lophiotrema nucula]|uniref:Cell division cycle protein 123 n=1 Tax=Lophiotrema nucula TaxID=690887 RepID=A0A6A5ZR44_9PLEO|nr:hypothetical protein BDV96DRAFT_667972 [Lophiotrema nucula]
MEPRIIPYSLVAADKTAIDATQDTSNPSSRSQRFSTAKHTRDEILPIVPETDSFKHTCPPWTPYCYTLWQPLIVKSQKISPEDCYVGRIPSFVGKDMLGASMAWATRGKLSNTLIDEICESWSSTIAGRKILRYLDGNRKWFVRLDQMSPKDSPLGGKLPSSTMRDVVTKLCSSMRAQGCLDREIGDAEREGRDIEIKLVLNLWNEEIDAAQEFRVFVPPPAAAERKELIYGYSFDVWLRRPDEVILIEINPFGALSGCGGSLFNWALDGRVMYGLEQPVFAVTLEKDKVTAEEKM